MLPREERQPPTRSTGTSVSGWKSWSAGRSTTGDAHQRSAGTAATQPAGAVLAGEEVEERRSRRERERLDDEQPGRADAERPERREQRDPRLDVVTEERPQVDRVERLRAGVRAARRTARRSRDRSRTRTTRSAAARASPTTSAYEAGDTEHDPAGDDVRRVGASAAGPRRSGSPARLVDGRRRHGALKSAWRHRPAARRASASRRRAAGRRARPSR